jgi:hypothetical protein
MGMHKALHSQNLKAREIRYEGAEWNGSGQDPVEDSFEHGNELLCSNKD